MFDCVYGDVYVVGNLYIYFDLYNVMWVGVVLVVCMVEFDVVNVMIY